MLQDVERCINIGAHVNISEYTDTMFRETQPETLEDLIFLRMWLRNELS